MILIFNTIFDILLLSDSFFKIQLSIDAKAFRLQKWRLILILIIAAGILGTLPGIRPVKSRIFLLCNFQA